MVKGKKSALLVGCDYYGTQYQRNGCANDVRMIEEILSIFKFDPANISKLVETNPPDPQHQPTYENIKSELENMMKDAKEGDVLFFYFSGLIKVNDQSNNNPAILCCDLEGLPATEFQSRANQLPKESIFTLVLESSNSAGFIDPVLTDDKRILFSACQENETPVRVDPLSGSPYNDITREYGVFTDAIKTVASHDGIKNDELLSGVNARITERYHQHAGLSCIANYRNVPFLGYLD